MEKFEKFQTEYQEIYGEELAIALENTPNGDSINVKSFYRRIKMLIHTYIKMISPTFDENNLSDYQQEQIWNAMLEQAYYTINVGDFSIFSGVDFTNNTIMDSMAIRKKIYSPISIDILRSSGLLYTGLSRGGKRW